MKQVLLFFAACIFSTSLFAQTTAVVKGQIVGRNDNAPLPYATISIAQESSPQTVFRRLASDKNRFGDLKSSVKRVKRGIKNDDVKSGGSGEGESGEK
ncbi:MAG: hypothetical protein LBS52_03740 [Dysgonamonadaceae bacterium]|jgi:hypothetical protein|nr:hypothetical protein [Dysgonamonadaceae bacterium]